jgi:glycosyltransferase involved in cell wall biosynthesis
VRVLFVTNMWPDEERPWYGSFVYSQARSLRSLGLDVDVLAIKGYATNWNYLRSVPDMLARSLRSSYDVVHAHYGHSAVVARLDVRRPLVISFCGDDLLGTPATGQPTRMTTASRVLARAFAEVSRFASATITKSERMELKLPRRVRARNHVIPNGVDLDMFKRMDRAAARALLRWPAEEKVALFVGNPAIERKNFALAERAAQLARARCADLRLRRATGIPPEEVPVWMSAADVLVHPSWSEGSPNVVKEAMACELPVVATPVGDVPERLRGIAGCHVLPPDGAAFAEALLDAMSYWPCTAAREAVANLSLARVAREIAGVYDSVAGTRPAL